MTNLCDMRIKDVSDVDGLIFNTCHDRLYTPNVNKSESGDVVAVISHALGLYIRLTHLEDFLGGPDQGTGQAD